MRLLSAPLLAAQKSASAVPYLKAVVSDRIGGIRRLAWSRLYTGSEPDGYHAAALPGDGSLIRARPSGGRVYYQRDWNLVVAGSDSSGVAFVWTCVFGDGFSQAPGTWSALREVSRASAGSGVSFRAPFLSQPDTFRLTFVETYTGSAAYKRP